MTKVIYDMPEEEYHALERLSSSGIKKLLVSSQDFWKSSWMNPDKEESDKKHLNEGKAYHTRLLEGQKAFDERYVIKPECDKRTKEGKAIYAEWAEGLPEEFFEVEEKLKREINAAVERIDGKPEHAKFFKGKPEVTLLWDDPETNVPMKSRVDSLSENKYVDLKTFSNGMSRNIDFVITSQITNYKYYLQAEVYREAIKNCLDKDDMEVWFFFQQTGGINNAKAVLFREDLLMAQKGRDEMRRGINKFAEMYGKFGTDEWFDDFDDFELIDESFPIYALEA